MIERKSGVDKEAAFKEACKNNGIVLTTEDSDLSAPSYIDLKGKKRVFRSEEKQDNKFRIGDLARARYDGMIDKLKKNVSYKSAVVDVQDTAWGKILTVRTKTKDGIYDSEHVLEKIEPVNNYGAKQKVKATRNAKFSRGAKATKESK